MFLAFLQNACLLIAGLEHTRADLVLEEYRWRNNLLSEYFILWDLGNVE